MNRALLYCLLILTVFSLGFQKATAKPQIIGKLSNSTIENDFLSHDLHVCLGTTAISFLAEDQDEEDVNEYIKKQLVTSTKEHNLFSSSCDITLILSKKCSSQKSITHNIGLYLFIRVIKI